MKIQKIILFHGISQVHSEMLMFNHNYNLIVTTTLVLGQSRKNSSSNNYQNLLGKWNSQQTGMESLPGRKVAETHIVKSLII